MSHKKGVYIDGHERDDVVRHRKSLLKTFGELRESHHPPPPCSDDPPRNDDPPRIRREEDEEKKELVVVYHDESTNEGQTWMWGEEDRPEILPKTKGSRIMVSDFVEEHGGYLQFTDQQLEMAKQQFPGIKQRARQLLEYGAEKEGYWTGDRFMKQVENAAKIADFKYPKDDYTIVWLFDQSSCHRKFDEQALLAKKILVKDEGPRRVRDTVWGRRANHGDRSCKGQFCWRGVSTCRVCVRRICE